MNKKTLLLISLMSLLIFTQSSLVSAQCDIVINMQDSYGDGWNGASIKVYDGSDLLGTATLTGNTSTGSATISAPDMTEISLVWTPGSYPGECAFTVTDGIGIDVYTCVYNNPPDPGEFLIFTNACSTTGIDLNLFEFILAPKVAVGEVEINGAVRSQRDTPITSFDLVYSIDGVDSEVSTFDNLNLAFNESFDFTHPVLADIVVGQHEVVLTIQNINGEGDDDILSNNSLTREVLCVNEIFAKNVVYEEGTGTWCGWCPRGLVGLNTMAHNYTDGSWIGIGVHNGDPMTLPEYDNGVGTFIGGYPSGVMNRQEVFDPGLGSLEPAYFAAIQEIPLAKIQVTAKTWDQGTRDITVEATSSFALDITGTSYNVAMVVVESGLTGTTSQWNQANYYSGGGAGDLIDWDGTNWAELSNPVPAADMVYHHVGRVLVGGWDGVPGTIPTDVVYGTDYTYTFEHTLAADFDPAQVDLVVMLIDATTGIIDNAFQVALEGGEILSPGFSADVVNGLAPLEVNFTDETVGGTVASWSWDFDMDGIEDSNEQNPSYIFEDGGDYTVTLTVTNETGETFTEVKENFIHSSGVGLEEIAESTFNCYPNPATDVINIRSENSVNSIRMFNIGGQMIYSIENSNSKYQTIDISSFEKGVYFLELSSDIETKNVKIVVE